VAGLEVSIHTHFLPALMIPSRSLTIDLCDSVCFSEASKSLQPRLIDDKGPDRPRPRCDHASALDPPSVASRCMTFFLGFFHVLTR
jgi:hypothetical protein